MFEKRGKQPDKREVKDYGGPYHSGIGLSPDSPAVVTQEARKSYVKGLTLRANIDFQSGFGELHPSDPADKVTKACGVLIQSGTMVEVIEEFGLRGPVPTVRCKFAVPEGVVITELCIDTLAVHCTAIPVRPSSDIAIGDIHTFARDSVQEAIDVQ